MEGRGIIFFRIIMFVCLCSVNFQIAFGGELVVRHIRPETEDDQRSYYYRDVLHLALEKTVETDGAFRLQMAEKAMFQDRAIRMLEGNKELDVVWTMTSREREQKLIPIRIPLLKGLLGHRIFIINRKDKETFAEIETFEDLKKLKAGQGHDWPDTEILRANGIEVVAASTYDGLFKMLARGRFDYFPRGVNEPWIEVRAHPDNDFIVEETLLLHYPAPVYFFVNQINAALVDRIERGLRLAIKDGSFDNIFYNHPITKEIFERAQMEERKVFQLTNPLLTPETPLDEPAFWYTR